MSRTLRYDIVTARKTYNCDACHWWLQSGYKTEDCDTEDQKLIVEAAIADGYKILRGQKYINAVYEDGGELITYRARPGMDSVVDQLGLVDD